MEGGYGNASKPGGRDDSTPGKTGRRIAARVGECAGICGEDDARDCTADWGYDQAIRQNRQYLGFLMILMQRLVTSSTRAIASALERRLEALNATDPATIEEGPPENNVEEQESQERLPKRSD